MRILAWGLGVFISLVPVSMPRADAGTFVGATESELAEAQRHYGEFARRRLAAWNQLLDETPGVEERERLALINAFFNQLRFTSDIEQWGKPDYWATPTEFLLENGGDCEDFALAKYFTLTAVGVPIDRLRLTYVHAVDLDQAHMVVTYYTAPDAEPLVLDNLVPEILPASRRTDLVPVYSFNGDGLWLAKQRGLGQRVSGAERISRWRDLTQRMDPQAAGPR